MRKITLALLKLSTYLHTVNCGDLHELACVSIITYHIIPPVFLYLF